MRPQTHAHANANANANADEKVLTQNGPNPYWHHPMYRVSQNMCSTSRGGVLRTQLAHPATVMGLSGDHNVSR